MKRLSSECMSLRAWACGKQKWKGQGAVGCQEMVECHLMQGAQWCKRDRQTRSSSALRRTLHAVGHGV